MLSSCGGCRRSSQAPSFDEVLRGGIGEDAPPRFLVMTIRRMNQIYYLVPQDARTDATIAFALMCSMMRDQTLGGRDGGSTSDDARTGDGTFRNRWAVQVRFTGVSPAAWPTKAVAQSRAIGQATPLQPDVSPGQQDMSSGIAVICVETEAAMLLPAAPMLTGPKMIPSRADSKSSRWMIAASFMRLSWHGAAPVGRGAVKMCRHADRLASSPATIAAAGNLPAAA